MAWSSSSSSSRHRELANNESHLDWEEDSKAQPIYVISKEVKVSNSTVRHAIYQCNLDLGLAQGTN